METQNREEQKDIYNQLIDLVKREYSKRKLNFSSEIGEVHPIYEAVAVLLKKQISDENAQKRLKTVDKDSLRSLIVADRLLEEIKIKSQKELLRNKFNSGETLDNLIEYASLCISENKRINEDGEVLYRLDGLSKREIKDFFRKKRRMRKKHRHEIYIKKELSNYLEINQKKFRRNRIFKYVLTTVIIGYLFASCSSLMHQATKILESQENSYSIEKIIDKPKNPQKPFKPIL